MISIQCGNIISAGLNYAYHAHDDALEPKNSFVHLLIGNKDMQQIKPGAGEEALKNYTKKIHMLTYPTIEKTSVGSIGRCTMTGGTHRNTILLKATDTITK